MTTDTLRVAFFTWRDVIHPRAGGSEVFIDHLARGLLERGHSVTLVAGDPVTRHPYRTIAAGGTYTQYLRAPLNYRRILPRPDLVVDVVNGMAPLSPLWHCGATVCMVHHVHTRQWPEHFPWPISVMGQRGEIAAIKNVYRDCLFSALSDSTAGNLRELGVDPARIRVVPAGVSIPPDPGETLETETPTFLLLGRLVPHKRVQLVLQAWERVRLEVGGRLLIAGDGPERPLLESMAPDDVEFLGEVSHETKQDLLKRSWLLVHAAAWEGWGLVILEAAGFRTPSLGFDVPGVRDAIDHERTGLLVTNTAELVQAWIGLARDRDRRAELGKAAREKALGLTWEHTVDQFEALMLESTQSQHRQRSGRRRAGGVRGDGQGPAPPPGVMVREPILRHHRAPQEPARAHSPLDCSILIPAFNEELRLPATLQALCGAIDPDRTEVVVIDDGSQDSTAIVAGRELAPLPHSAVIRLPLNAGKGAAVREGVRRACGRKLLYMDADLATDLRHLPELLAALDDHDIAIGSRASPGSEVHGASLLRAVMGRGWNRLIRAVSPLPYRDTQCGFKAFRTPVARVLFELGEVDRFAFDVEILSLARRLGFTIAELPVSWHARPGSKIRPVADSLGTALDLRRATRRRSLPAIEGILVRGGTLSGEVLAPEALQMRLGDDLLVVLPGWSRYRAESLASALALTEPSLSIDPCTVDLECLRAGLG